MSHPSVIFFKNIGKIISPCDHLVIITWSFYISSSMTNWCCWEQLWCWVCTSSSISFIGRPDTVCNNSLSEVRCFQSQRYCLVYLLEILLQGLLDLDFDRRSEWTYINCSLCDILVYYFSTCNLFFHHLTKWIMASDTNDSLDKLRKQDLILIVLSLQSKLDEANN